MPTILCVEDEADLRESLVEELRDAGYRTIEAGDGRAALEVLAEHRPDLVLCDVRMPVMNGHALLRAVRERRPDLADVPFVFLSALGSRHDIIEGKGLGADDYLTKPVDFDLLLVTVESRLRQVARMRGRRDDKLVRLYRHLTQRPGEDAAQTPETGPAAELNARVVRFARDNQGSVTLGRMQLVGLRAVKEELGSRWDEVAAKVRAIAEGLIKDRLAPEDVLTRRPDDEFVICFASLSETEAALKARAIERELANRILGSRPIARLTDTMDTPLDRERLTEVTTETRTLEIEPSELERAEDPLAVLLGKLERAAASARARATTIMTRLRRTCRFTPRLVRRPNGAPTRLRILDFDTTTREQVSQLRRMAAEDAHTLGELDLVILGTALQRIYDTVHEDSDLLAIPLSFDTLKSKTWSSHIFRTLSNVDKIHLHRVAIKLSNFPIPSHYGIFADKYLMLRSYARLIILDIERPFVDATFLRDLRFSIVSMTYASYLTHLHESNIGAFVKKVHTSGARLLIDQIPRDRANAPNPNLVADFMAFARS